MSVAMKVLVVFVSVVLFTCAAKKIAISEDNKNLFRARCRALAAGLPDADNRCDQGLAKLLEVESNKGAADFGPFLDALGFVVPTFGGGAYNPLFWTAFDGQAGYTDDKGREYNPYKIILHRNAGVLPIWTSYNILPAALMNDETFSRARIVPGFLVWPFWQQYSQWMALHTETDVPSMWLTGGTDNGYFPKPPNGRRPSVALLGL